MSALHLTRQRAVLVLRVKRPEAHRPFRVPGGSVFPILGILSCVYLMLNLPVLTWARFLVWLDLGMIIYWLYGRRMSPLADEQESARRTGFQGLANVVYVFGALGVFNFACVTLLAYMTILGITSETIAKWHEIGVTPEGADSFALRGLAVAIVIFAAGWGLRKAAKADSVS